MAHVVYLSCAIMSLACAVLLLRKFAQTGARLLLWSGLCFGALTVNNALVFVDLAVVPSVSLSMWRHAAALVGIVVLLVGLIWEAR